MDISNLAYVPFISVDNMMRLVHHVGLERFLVELAEEIEADFRRWEQFRQDTAHCLPQCRGRDRTDADQ